MSAWGREDLAPGPVWVSGPKGIVEIPPQRFTDWTEGRGARLLGGNQVCACGAAFEVAAQRDPAMRRYGRVFIFPTFKGGTGPASRGDYLFALGEDVFAATEGGRLAVRWETYKLGDGEAYAWVAVLADHELRCPVPGQMASCNG